MIKHTDHYDFSQKRRRMVERDLTGRGITDQRVLRAMGEVPRENFVPETSRWQAYADGPLPIGCNQTISQPYIVALMTQELRVTGEMDVLELGTGSGYQTAILAKLARRVYTVERFEALSAKARAILTELGIDNVEFAIGDGSCGWPEERSFERIIVTAALPAVPQVIINQLAEGGIIVAPVGGSAVQRLIAGEKKGGELKEHFVCDVRFVPIVGKHGFAEP